MTPVLPPQSRVMPLQSREIRPQSRDFRLQLREFRPGSREIGPGSRENLPGGTRHAVTRSSRNPRITNSGRRGGVSARRSPGSFSASALSAAAISTRARGAPTQ